MSAMDTRPEAQAAQTEALRSLTGVQRLTMAIDMSIAARELSLTRLRLKHPEWPDARLQLELIRYSFLPGEPPPALR